MRRLLAAIIVLSTLFVAPEEQQAGIFGDIWNGIKSVASGAGSLIAAPFGGFVQGLIAPAVDHAASALKEITDHATDQINDVLKDRIHDINQVAKDRINRLNDVLTARLDQVDTILKGNLKTADDILRHTLDREAVILDATVTRVDELLDRDLDRLEDLQKDAFNHIQAALEDQVPFAAGQVARQLVAAAIVIIFLIVLVGYGGVHMLRAASAQQGSYLSRVGPALRQSWKPVVAVAVPMAALSAIIWIGYFIYYSYSDYKRVSRIEAAAEMFEQVGDFKAAFPLRRRALGLTTANDEKRRFYASRDSWLADTLQSRRHTDPAELILRLNGLAHLSVIQNDGELEAARIYLLNRFRPRDVAPPADFLRSVASYETGFLRQEHRPVLGKLVGIVIIDLKLEGHDGSADASLKSRYANAANFAKELEGSYPKYAPARLLHAQLLGALADAAELSPAPTANGTPVSKDEVNTDIQLVSALDLDLARIVRIGELQLPADLVDRVEEALSPGTHADLRKGINDYNMDVSTRISEFVDHRLIPDAMQIVQNETVAKLKSEEQLRAIIGRDVGEKKLHRLVSSALDLKRSGTGAIRLFRACLDVAQEARRIGMVVIAEQWAQEAQKILNELKPGSVPAAQRDEVKQLLTDLNSYDPRRTFIVL